MFSAFEQISARRFSARVPGEAMPSTRLPCHIAHFVSTFAIKSDTKWLLQLARYMDRDAFRLTAVCFYDGGPVQEQLEALGVRTYNLNTPNERDPRAFLRARKLIDELRPDIVHTHLLRADLIGGAAARWAGVPVIVSTVYALGQFRREKRRRSDRLLDAACSRLATHTIAVSQAVADDLVGRLRVDPKNISVIHTGIESPPEVDPTTAKEVRRAWGVGDGAPVVLTVARLSYEKGLDAFLDVAAVLHRVHSCLRFVVVGEGKDRARLSARIERLGLRGVVNLAGFVPDVWPALAAADVVCIPSKSEGMPNVLLEAMAMGKPVVVTRVGGIPEAVESGVNGLMVEPERPGEIAKAILRVLGDSTLRARLGSAARRTVCDRFDAADMNARYEALYRRLLSKRRIGRETVVATH